MSDLEYMEQALACARSVEGRTSPRPPVGAVVVRDNQIVGRGATSPPFGPHAEVHAIMKAGEAARGADLYVTLEPCCVAIHTPACTNAIIEAGIQRVIIGSLDPNPLVSGRGANLLREAGMQIVTGIAEAEAARLVRPFATYITQGRPYVTAKWAMTLDGKIATHTGDAYWISGSSARLWVHNLRDTVDAIMVGSGTVRADDPLLTVRLSETERVHQRVTRANPLRVVVSSSGELNAQLKLLQAGTCVLLGENTQFAQQECLRERGVEVIAVPVDQMGYINLAVALEKLAQRGIMHLLVEGGSRLLGSFFDQKLIDHVAAFISPKIVGGSESLSPIGGSGLAVMQDAYRLRNISTRIIDDDLLFEGDMIQAK